jgi:nicotinamide phosphoribosyltransferase
MQEINAMLLKDFYKAVHSEMIPAGMTKSVSYFTPRMSRINRWTHVVNFGLQAFIKTWLIDYFNKNFFNRNRDDVLNEYKHYIENTLGRYVCDFEKIEKLYRKGYLPIEIVSLPEGVLVPMHCPIFGITNTDPEFAWLGQALESLISAEMWYPMICATVGHSYREVVNKFYEETCDDEMPRRRALGNFDFRGDQGVDAALKAGSGWALSFVNTATVPVIPYLEKMYNSDINKEEVGFGAVSTEHFVMCSNSAFDTLKNPDETYEFKDIDPYRERVFIKRALTELYPNTSFSCVCDSYDYWNVVDNILPTLKDEILAHNGCFLVRGDSGDCVKVVTETVFKLWNIFGGTVNSKGYKVLDPHVKALYGDSITIQRAEYIYSILKENGFAACNVSLGVGSFSMHCIEEEGYLKPFTRDTFSFAIKAVYAEFTDEKGNVTKMPIFKDPKTDREAGGGNFKKSQKGCCIVSYYDGDYHFTDNHTWEEASLSPNLMRPVFRNGYLIEPDNLHSIRQRLNNFEF